MNEYMFTKKQLRYLKIKRIFDVFFAVFLLIILSPIMLFTAILVKTSSKGPVIFKQKRPGKNKKIFTILKFRSMKIETNKNDRDLHDFERVTFLGKILRKTSIDELPQLFNIIKGDMSFIGPRPFLINDLGSYTPEQEIRFEILPGITSWTAIHGRNTVSVQDKYNMEIYYAKNISLKLDIKIFFKTILVVLSAKNVVDNVNKPRIASKIIDEEGK
ncbi:MAG: sugar transferase [Firmicutes bacterium]|nr:sugar transferase [Bacillota bacterium]